MARPRKKHEVVPRKVDVALPPPLAPADPADEPWRDECANLIEGWDALPEMNKREAAANLRRSMETPTAPAYSLVKSEGGSLSLLPAPGRDEVANAINLEATFAGSGGHAAARVDDLINHFTSSNPGKGCSERDLNAALAFVSGARAEDTVQSTLAVQMVATHDAAMRALRAVGANPSIEVTPVFGNLAVKLLNAYTRQAETLAKLQRGGEQIIKHIHIDNRGGQAVVTDQLVTGGQNAESRDQSHAAVAIGGSPALLGQDPFGSGVPVAGGEGEEALQNARRDEPGRAKR